MKNFSFLIILSLPLTMIFVCKKIFKHRAAHFPIIFPPNKTILVGNTKDGKNTIEIIDTPRKKKNKKRNFLIIFIKN